MCWRRRKRGCPCPQPDLRATPRDGETATRPSKMIDAQILQDLHDEEINGSIEWMYDRAWSAQIGLANPVTSPCLSSLEDALAWLRNEAVRLYPDSDFAKKYGRGFL